MMSQNSGTRSTGGASELEQFMLNGFKWGALGLTGIFATGVLAMVLSMISAALDAALAPVPVPPVPENRPLERYIDARPRLEESPGLPDLPRPVFTSMPEATRKSAYQSLYNRVLETGKGYEIIDDEDRLITLVNGAITELDSANHPVKGTYAYVYLAELTTLADELGARVKAEDPKIPDWLSLEVLAQGLADDLRQARDARVNEGITLAAPGPDGADTLRFADQIYITLILVAGMMLSAGLWGLLTFLAQGKTYWIVMPK
ncbi:MAG: hypothetical protein ACFB6R_17050 [Alphaproteobacteria bacterium]